MRKTQLLLAAMAGLMTCTGALADPMMIVDGDLSDWKINPSKWTSSKKGVQSTIEDDTGKGAFYLNPGWGGQAYDAEALYALKTQTHVFIALATGHAPDTPNNPGKNSFGAGDFAIDFGRDGTYEVGINVKPSWDKFGEAKGVYLVSKWEYGLWGDGIVPEYLKSDHPTSIAKGTQIGIAELEISEGKTNYGDNKKDTHYFYEIGLSLDLLTKAGWEGESFNIHWTQNCANDSIIVDPPAVPEPGTLALLPLGMLGLLVLRRRGSAG